MAGTQGRKGEPKYPPVNRNEYLDPLHFTGIEIHQRVISAPQSTPILTGAQLLGADQLYITTTPNALTGPTAMDMGNAIVLANGLLGDNAVGAQVLVWIENTDPVNPKVITFGAGVTPATLTIPAASKAQYYFEVTSVYAPQAVPPTVETFSVGTYSATTPPSAAGVTSFNGRTGPVVSVAGDYTAAQVTEVPSGKLLLADTNVQLALDRLAGEPVGYATGGAVPTVATVWTNVPVTFVPATSRGAFAQSGLNAIVDGNPVDPGKTLTTQIYVIARTAGVVAPAAGQMGVRIMRNGVNVVGQVLNENDQSGLVQIVTCTAQFGSNPGDIYTVDVMNNLGVVITIQADMVLHSVGQNP